MGRKWTPEEKKAASVRAKAQIAANPQTKTQNETTTNPLPTPVDSPTPAQAGPSQNITLTQEQFNALISRLDAGSTIDKVPAPSMTPGIGLQTNPFGQVVGTATKFNVDPNYYPNPIERLLTEFDKDNKMSRFNLRENYFITFDMTAKPYQTKDNLSIQEPTFHTTLYQNRFNEQGEAMDEAWVIQTLHMNEDEELARLYSFEEGINMDEVALRDLMDETRYYRIKQWLLGLFFPPINFGLTKDDHEEAIGGTVVKVVTKSNVKGFGNPAPVVSDQELGIG